MALARVAIWLDPIATAKSGKQTPVPTIGKAEAHLDALFGPFYSIKRGANPLDCGGCGVALSWRCGPLKEGGNLAQFLTKFLFTGQFLGFSFPEQTRQSDLGGRRGLMIRDAVGGIASLLSDFSLCDLV